MISVQQHFNFSIKVINEHYPHQNQAKEDTYDFIKKVNEDMKKAAIDYADGKRTMFCKTEKMKPYILTDICIDLTEPKSLSSGLEGIALPTTKECIHSNKTK